MTIEEAIMWMAKRADDARNVGFWGRITNENR